MDQDLNRGLLGEEQRPVLLPCVHKAGRGGGPGLAQPPGNPLPTSHQTFQPLKEENPVPGRGQVRLVCSLTPGAWTAPSPRLSTPGPAPCPNPRWAQRPQLTVVVAVGIGRHSVLLRL